MYLYRAVDKAGDTVDFLLSAKRDKAAVRRYLKRAINLYGSPEKITIGKSGANTAALRNVNDYACLDIELRQCKYLNHIVEQNHRAVKRVTDPMLGFKPFWNAQKLVVRIETMHKVKKGQFRCPLANPCPPLSSSTAWLSDLEALSSHFYATCLLLRQN